MKIKIGIFILCIIGCCFIAYKTLDINLDKIQRIEEIETIPVESEDFITQQKSAERPTINEIDLDYKEIEPFLSDDLINILLVGQDRRPNEGRQRSDSMMVCSINIKTEKVSLISFLRDLYVKIPGYSNNRLNSAYAFGGFPLLKETLAANFGILIDGCFEVDFDGFRALIDQIGGVDIEMSDAEANVVEVEKTGDFFHLNGQQALTYARIRKLDSDFQRTGRQRKVLLAAFEKVRGSSLSEIISMIKTALPYVATDMSNRQIMALGSQLFFMFRDAKINTYFIPPEGTYSDVYVNGMAVLYPDLEMIRAVLEKKYLPIN